MEPPAATWQLSQSAPTTFGRSLVAEAARRTTFSTDLNVSSLLKPPAAVNGSATTTPQTGLSVLMSGSVTTSANGSSTTTAAAAAVHDTTPGSILTKRVMASLSPAQQQRYRQDLLERENQASSLAAAGMVAEEVSLTGAPPHPLSSAEDVDCSDHSAEVNPIGNADTNMNWSLMDNLYNMHLDDMDMDFATLFDPVNEMMWNNLSANSEPQNLSSSEVLSPSPLPQPPPPPPPPSS